MGEQNPKLISQFTRLLNSIANQNFKPIIYIPMYNLYLIRKFIFPGYNIYSALIFLLMRKNINLTVYQNSLHALGKKIKIISLKNKRLNFRAIFVDNQIDFFLFPLIKKIDIYYEMEFFYPPLQTPLPQNI